jgi:hypothetical protein
VPGKSKQSYEELRRQNEELAKEVSELKKKNRLKVKRSRKVEQAAEKKLVADFAVNINRGMTRDEIISELGISSNDFDRLHSTYYKQVEREQSGKSPLRIFSEYVGLQHSLVKTLWDFVEHQKKENYTNSQAFVASIRAQSDILDKIIKTGQELGVIVRTPEKILIVDGNDARDMDSAELRHHTLRKINEVKAAVENNKNKKRSAKVIQFKGLKDQQEGRTG